MRLFTFSTVARQEVFIKLAGRKFINLLVSMSTAASTSHVRKISMPALLTRNTRSFPLRLKLISRSVPGMAIFVGPGRKFSTELILVGPF